LTSLPKARNVVDIGDKYFYKREKVANLLFDLVKYLLTALGAMLLFTDKSISTGIVVIIAFLAILVFIFGIFITPRKED
jgi:glycerol-3-phosphate acyltransferase PlsY